MIRCYFFILAHTRRQYYNLYNPNYKFPDSRDCHPSGHMHVLVSTPPRGKPTPVNEHHTSIGLHLCQLKSNPCHGVAPRLVASANRNPPFYV
jgi:hypothetical protein